MKMMHKKSEFLIRADRAGDAEQPHPQNCAGFPGVRKMLEEAKLMEKMQVGVHGESRTPVSELREAIQWLDEDSKGLSSEWRNFVKSISDGMLAHIGCSNTDVHHARYPVFTCPA